MTSVDRYIIVHPDFYDEFASFGEVSLRQWRDVHDRLLQACFKVWDAVKEVLCFDSPEGHVMIDPDDDEPDVGVKDTLSYCWRALKEARYVYSWFDEPRLTTVAL